VLAIIKRNKPKKEEDICGRGRRGKNFSGEEILAVRGGSPISRSLLPWRERGPARTSRGRGGKEKKRRFGNDDIRKKKSEPSGNCTHFLRGPRGKAERFGRRRSPVTGEGKGVIFGIEFNESAKGGERRSRAGVTRGRLVAARTSIESRQGGM